MTDLSYHLESETRGGKNYLAIRLVSASQRKLTKDNLFFQITSLSEKNALELLLKNYTPPIERLFISADKSLELLKLLGTTGRVFYQGKKVFIDPFSSYEIYFEGERLSTDQARFSGCWALGSKSGGLTDCDWIFPADPSWILKEGIIRPVKEDISGKWVAGACQPQLYQGIALAQFLDKAFEERSHRLENRIYRCCHPALSIFSSRRPPRRLCRSMV